MIRIQQALVCIALIALFLASSDSAFAKIAPRETDRSELSDLVQALERGDWLTQVYAINGLIGMRPREAALPALVGTLQSRNSQVTITAADALGSFGPKAKEAIAALLKLLRKGEISTRLAAADALVRIRGRSSPEVKATIIQGLKDPNWSTRAQAVFALGRLGPEEKWAVPLLVEALKDEKIVRNYAVVALASMGHPIPKEAVPALIEVLNDETSFALEHAAKALGHMGLAAKDAVPSLVRAMEDPSPRVRSGAREALGRMKLLDKTVPVSFFIERLKDEDSVRRRGAAMALGEIGPPAKEAIPALLWMLERDLTGLRVHAALALVMIGYTEAEVVSPMAETLNGLFRLTPEFEAELLEALKRVDSPDAKEAVKRYLERHQKQQNGQEDQGS